MLNIVTVTKRLDESVTGAVENVCLWITRNTFAAKDDCRIVSLPEKNLKTFKKLIKNIGLLIKILSLTIKNEDLMFIYPSIPIYPATSEKKYYLATAYYRILRAVKGKSRIFTYLIDLPKEQEESFGIQRINIDKKKLLKFEDMLFSMSDVVIAASSGFKTLLLERGCSYGEKIDVLPVALRIKAKNTSSDGEKIRIFYSGELEREYEKNMLKAIAHSLTDAELIICGRSGDWINDEKLVNAEYKGYVDTNTHDEIAKSCDFAIVCYPNNGYYKYVTPSKLCTYMGLELPVLSVKNDTISKLLDEYEIGECVEAQDFPERVLDWCDNKIFSDYKAAYNELDFYENCIEKLRNILKK